MYTIKMLKIMPSDPRYPLIEMLTLELCYLYNPQVHFNLQEKAPEPEFKVAEAQLKDEINDLIKGNVIRSDN